MTHDFWMVAERPKRGYLEIYPKFIVRNGGDLMIRGKDFYAVWNESTGFWSTDENVLIRLIDTELDAYANEKAKTCADPIHVLHLWDAETKMIDAWHTYCQKQRRDCWHVLDENLIFANSPHNKEDYASKSLDYALMPGDYSAYDEMISTLYAPDERAKLEWCIGAIVSGDSKEIQKFAVLYGSHGTGKSTMLNIVDKLFKGYTAIFSAKSLGSASESFALEAFRNNPLVAIQHDGDLSRIDDNTRLNSLISHERMLVNEKHKGQYENTFRAFLLMGTNEPVKITDAKSGLIRRLIDISPTGEKIPKDRYTYLYNKIDFELGAIASHCLDVYKENPKRYDDYMPLNMMGATNDFYNFMVDSYMTFEKQNSTTLAKAWEMWQLYTEEAKVPWPMSKMKFKEELKSYFREYKERGIDDKGNRVRSYYSGFRTEKFGNTMSDEPEKPSEKPQEGWLIFRDQPSLLDVMLAQCAAQLVVEGATYLPKKWANNTTILSDIDTKLLHHVKVPLNHIVIDFDIPDENGQKCLALNLEAANKFPPTYAELSKSGQGIHLHYLYAGDPTTLSASYAPNIEIKVFTGDMSLRRKLTKCNDIPVATFTGVLPTKEEKIMINFDGIKDDRHLHNIIIAYMKKARSTDPQERMKTVCAMQLIAKTVQQAYDQGLSYDIHDMYNALFQFSLNSTNSSQECLDILAKMKLDGKSADIVESHEEAPIVFFDVEVFPNLFIVCWSLLGEEDVNVMINPEPEDIEKLCKFRLIGYNNKRYDNYILYAAMLGYSNEKLFELSQRIINTGKYYMKEADNISYTDIFDFLSIKQSLKLWEIQLHIFHQECPFAWDQPVPREHWEEVADYCCNDVRATKAVWNANQGDWVARQILADWGQVSANTSTNNLTGLLVFGDSLRHEDALQWRDMGDMSKANGTIYFKENGDVDEYTVFDEENRPIYPGYKFEFGHSIYRNEDPKEGGYVYAEPGVYVFNALLDIASMHPSSAIAEKSFGEYTKNFEMIKLLRVHIKHKDFDKAREMLPERMHHYLDDETKAAALEHALKIAINAVYGLTSAKFVNQFKSMENVDNIVAKRGALFMINLKHRVQEMGYTVVHIKTDSIKIANADMKIIKFVKEYGLMYQYVFEHEATYERICLVNNAVYIARYATMEQCIKLYGEDYVNESKDQLKGNKKHGGEWTATGTQFQVPYVFKTLFSKEPIEFYDTCETKSVNSPSCIYLNYNESGEDNRVFVGKVGYFCPVLPGTGGALLQRTGTDASGMTKYDSVTGTKGYYWRNADDVLAHGLEGTIDHGYYRAMVDKAVAAINEFAGKTGFDPSIFLSQDYYEVNENVHT